MLRILETPRDQRVKQVHFVIYTGVVVPNSLDREEAIEWAKDSLPSFEGELILERVEGFDD